MSMPSIPSFQLPAMLRPDVGAGAEARASPAPGGASLLPAHYQGIAGNFQQRAAGHDPQHSARSLQQHFHAPPPNAFQGGQRPSHPLLARAGSLLSGLRPFQKLQGGMAAGGLMAAGSKFSGLFGSHAPGSGHAGAAHGHPSPPHISMPEPHPGMQPHIGMPEPHPGMPPRIGMPQPHPGMQPHAGYGELAGGYQSRIQGYDPQHCAGRLNEGFHLPGPDHDSHSKGGLGNLFGGKGLGKLMMGLSALGMGSSFLSMAGAMATLGAAHGMMHGLDHFDHDMFEGFHGMHGMDHFDHDMFEGFHGMHGMDHFDHDMFGGFHGMHDLSHDGFF